MNGLKMTWHNIRDIVAPLIWCVVGVLIWYREVFKLISTPAIVWVAYGLCYIALIIVLNYWNYEDENH